MALVLFLGIGTGKAAPLPAVKARTPKEAFDAFTKAAADRDLRRMTALMAPELADKTTEKVLAGVALALGRAEASKGDARKFLRPIYDILAKHGVTKDDLKKATDKAEGARHIKDLAAKVKDKPGLLGDLMEFGNRSRKVERRPGLGTRKKGRPLSPPGSRT
jgi:hypothetical protein